MADTTREEDPHTFRKDSEPTSIAASPEPVSSIASEVDSTGMFSFATRLASLASLTFNSATILLKVASDAQFPASSQVIELDSSSYHDDPEFRTPKRVKLAHGDTSCQEESIRIGQQHNMGASNQDAFYEEAVHVQPPKFQYRPLNIARREIRLLVLHPSEDILDLFTYSCTLIYVSADEDPVYEALSYVWGSEANKQKILVDGQEMLVTANLAGALDYLYDSDGPRKLWVDAICINQEDIPERSQQVQNMTEIYTKAKNVVVWIGLLELTTQNLLHRLAHPDQSPEHLRKWTASGDRIPGDPSALNEEEKRLLSELAQNPWFRRIWVVQEVSVAREVIVQTGRTTISWSAFGAALENCNDNHEMKSVIEAVSTISAIRAARSREPYYMDLFVLLERFRHCLATDERDKVFALLGLTSSSLPQERVVQVTPDYSKPAIDIYRSIAREYINKRKNLDIICHATLPGHMPIPSWVPSWSWYNPGLTVLPKRRISCAGHEPMYRCCGDLELDREILFGTVSSSNRLWLNGFKFDVVSIIGSVATKTQDLGLEAPINGVSDSLKVWKSMSEICSHVYGSNLEEAFRRTLLADAIGGKRYQENTPSIVATKEAREGTLVDDNVRESSPDFVYLIEGRLGTTEKESKSSLEERLNHRTDLLEASMKRAAIKRAFFVTEKGHMGLGPSSMEERDLVYVLAGGQVPFILRPTIIAEGFSLVGESYIHGIMDGEATVLEIKVETIYLV